MSNPRAEDNSARPWYFATIATYGIPPMSKPITPPVSLSFPLQVEDGGPPVATECLPFDQTEDGVCALVPPLFVKDISVGDILSVEKVEEHLVKSWQHVRRSTVDKICQGKAADSREAIFAFIFYGQLGRYGWPVEFT
jgi:hypothetical protein